MSELEHMAQGRVLWLEAKTHDNVSISTVNVHRATAKRHDLQRQATLLLRAMIDAALTQRRIMGGDFNTALSRYGYAPSTSALASLDHIITWNLTCTNTCTMQGSTSKVHWVGAECNDHALMSCTVVEDLLTYRKGQVVGGRPGELKLKEIDPKQLRTSQDLEGSGDIKGGTHICGEPEQASAAAMQCLAEFGIYHDLRMTLQEAHHVALCPQ